MNFIEALKIVFLGIVEGITEWLPISSTGHMLLVDEFVNISFSQAFKNMFFVVIQLGAIIAVVLLFWKKMFPFSFRKGEKHVKMNIIMLWLKVAVALVPSVIAGLFLDEFLEEHLSTPLVISIMLIVYGILFIVIEIWNRKRQVKVDSLEDIPWLTAFLIGCFQVLAMIPGTSRSGATIIGALIIGVSRTAAAEFTFFLAVPTMLGASVLKLFKFGLSFTGAEISALILGMAVAFIVSVFAIKFLMNYIKKNDFRAFGYYRIVLGLAVIIYFACTGRL